jgi:hypothetical protein
MRSTSQSTFSLSSSAHRLRTMCLVGYFVWLGRREHASSKFFVGDVAKDVIYRLRTARVGAPRGSYAFAIMDLDDVDLLSSRSSLLYISPTMFYRIILADSLPQTQAQRAAHKRA